MEKVIQKLKFLLIQKLINNFQKLLINYMELKRILILILLQEDMEKVNKKLNKIRKRICFKKKH